MAKNLLVINVDLRETRVALIEDGIIAELHLERASTRSTLGNIVVGKVTRVLPGMQAAFIDIGQERAAFLHVEDLIRPDDFEAYLTGGKRPDEEEKYDDESSGSAEGPVEPSAAIAMQVPIEPESIDGAVVNDVSGAELADDGDDATQEDDAAQEDDRAETD